MVDIKDLKKISSNCLTTMLLILCLASINAHNATIKATQNSSDLIELKTEAINIKNCIQLFRSNHLAIVIAISYFSLLPFFNEGILIRLRLTIQTLISEY